MQPNKLILQSRLLRVDRVGIIQDFDAPRGRRFTGDGNHFNSPSSYLIRNLVCLYALRALPIVASTIREILLPDALLRKGRLRHADQDAQFPQHLDSPQTKRAGAVVSQLLGVTLRSDAAELMRAV